MNQYSQKPLTYKRWIWLSTAGWFIGIFLIVGLAMLGETILQTKEDSGGQAAVGIGMGAGVGFMQWVMLRKYLPSVQKWLWFSILGFTLTYVSFDLIAGNSSLEIKPEVFLPLATTFGALLSAYLQYQFVLKKVSSKSLTWLAYNTIAWSLAHILVTGMFLINMPIASGLPKVFIVILVLGFICTGGPLLGFITGRFIVPFMNRHAKQEM